MREEKTLAHLLRDLAELVSQEAERNPEFAQRLESILSGVPVRRLSRNIRKSALNPADLPDIFGELKARGELEFELWLKTLEAPVLKALIKLHDLDASKRSQKWTEPEKLARLICQQIHARVNKGSAFLKNTT
ncbi:MAG TPA: hypothetical protein VFC44_12565 [Candidatus Saccharimonadales bacterium]|nr:hypothetical protein [Candidatus Saccharimonadales bacterium]